MNTTTRRQAIAGTAAAAMVATMPVKAQERHTLTPAFAKLLDACKAKEAAHRATVAATGKAEQRRKERKFDDLIYLSARNAVEPNIIGVDEALRMIDRDTRAAVKYLSPEASSQYLFDIDCQKATVIAAYEDQLKKKADWDDECGYTAAQAEYDRSFAEWMEAEKAIIAFPVTTGPDLRAKGEYLQEHWQDSVPSNDDLDALIRSMVEA